MSEPTALVVADSGLPIHRPVMPAQIVDLLSVPLATPGAVCLDLTCGMGGHAAAILRACPGVSLLGFDQDAQAIAIAEPWLTEQFGSRVRIVQARFDQVDEVCREMGIDQVHAILADLGLSSLQIDQRERGFAYATDAPLDMRMDDRAQRTAAEVVNTYSATELADIFTRYGEQPAARRLAEAVVEARRDEPFDTSARLVEVIIRALPAALRHRGGHPAKRIFQALRIEVNDELGALAAMLPQATGRLAGGGRMAVLAYHSLEDRLVKRHFAELSQDTAPRGLPVVPEEYRARFRLVTRGVHKPDEQEMANNPRATSARLRVIERCEQGEDDERSE